MKKLLSIITIVTALVLAALPLMAFADSDDLSTPNISVTTSTSSSTRSATFTLKTDSSGAKIYYTTNGSDPTTSSKRYTGSVKVTSSCEVRAVAYDDGEYSDVGYYTVTVSKARVATPTLKATNVVGGKKITITCSGASAIYYTTDGSTPTTSDKKYTSSGITVNESCTVKAIGVRSGYADSKVATGIVNISQVSGTPTVKKSSTTSGTKITISGPLSSCTYYYTTDGSTPTTTTSSTCKKYSSGITVSKACTVKFIACKSGYAPSDVYSVTVDGIQCAKPTATATNVAGGKKITLKTTTSGASIYYTTDGTTPSSSDTKYTSSGITIDEEGTTVIRAVAVKSGYSDSDVVKISVSVTQLDTPTLAKVTSSSSSSSYKIKVTSTSGSTIYYTTNGSTPTASGKSISSGSTISISSSCTLKVMAVKKGYVNSEVVTAKVTVSSKSNTVATPTVTYTQRTSDGENYSRVTIKCSTSGATIYYTTNGKDPFDYGDVYTGAFDVDSSCTVKVGAKKSNYNDSDIATYSVKVKGDDIVVLDADTEAEVADEAAIASDDDEVVTVEDDIDIELNWEE